MKISEKFLTKKLKIKNKEIWEMVFTISEIQTTHVNVFLQQFNSLKLNK